MLKISDVSAGYGDLKVLQGLNLHVDEGEVVALVGSNGVGKTTTLRVISGIVAPTNGKVEWYDQDITNFPTYQRPVLGIAHILQGRGILGTLTVKDNLILGAYTKRTKHRRDELMESGLELFPILKERFNQPASALSGGQQQMLAIARALMMDPKLLILDEPSLGLAPIIVDEVFHIIERLKAAGTSILIIEQNLTKALKVADRGYVMENGRIVLEGAGLDVLNNPDVKKAYLGI